MSEFDVGQEGKSHWPQTSQSSLQCGVDKGPTWRRHNWTTLYTHWHKNTRQQVILHPIPESKHSPMLF